MLTRRHLLCGAAAAGAGVWMSPVRNAIAASNSRTKFIFITNFGGWDPTRVFASEFANPNVDMERDADPRTLGDLTYVDHPDRPSVKAFFDKHASKTAFFNGILVPSISHENCRKLIMTGSSRQGAADWGAIVAGAAGQDYALPQVVAAGASFPGDYGIYVTRTGTQGQLPSMLNGEILSWSDAPVTGPSASAEAVMDQYLKRRADASAAAATLAREKALKETFATSLGRGQALKGIQDQLSWTTSGDADEQSAFAVSLLSLGVSRVVTLEYYNSWDSHTNNDTTQLGSWENLFGALGRLMDMLAAKPGTAGGATLADETVVVVLSEMGRTPKLNGNLGKDHWPYTAAMAVGPGLNGGRVYGGYDIYYYGRKLDFASGDFDDDNGKNLSSDVFGATLLGVAGLDSQEFLPGVGSVAAAVKG